MKATHQLHYKSGIARRLIMYMIVFSSTITVITTGAQLLWDYKGDVDAINQHLQQAETVHVKILAATLWASDIDKLKNHLEGLSQLSDIKYVEVKDENKIWAAVGDRRAEDSISREFPIQYFTRGRNLDIGTFTIVASLEDVYKRLLDKTWMILASNGIKTFLVAGFMLWLFHNLNTRHLVRIADYTRSWDVTQMNGTLSLDRNDYTDSKDELDMVVVAINKMQVNIVNSFTAQRQSEERFKVLADVSPMGIFRSDAKGNCVYVNRRWCRLTGKKESELLDRSWLLLLNPDDHKLVSRQWNTLLENDIACKVECRVLGKDGEDIWILVLAAAEKDDQGANVGYVGAIIDITERKIADAEIQQHRHHLEELVEERTTDLITACNVADQANAAKSKFLSRMSHELRTPLNAILGFAQILNLDSSKMEQYQRENISEILVAGQHLLNLINEVLDLAKIESGKMDINMSAVSIDELMQQCIPMIMPQAAIRHLHIVDELSNRGHMVQADSKRLKQVFLNILSNAVKYNREHGEIVLCSEHMDDQHLRIRITDNGNGINKENLLTLFKPFERLDADDSTEGTGIGLTISKHLMELMQGELGVDSEVGKGTTFWVDLELSRAA